MISRNFNWDIMTFSKLNHIRMKCSKVITFIECIYSMFPITVPLECLIVYKSPIFKIITL